jgi:mono/diheme cytochrome c family protein
MPAMGLSNEEVADVMNYIMNSWSNKQSKKVTKEEVANIKK